MKTAIVYARYSSDRQTEQSIEGQLRVCNDYAEKNGLVIGAGSVVTRDIPENSLAVGNPARVVRKITDSDAIELKKELF